MLSPQYFVHVYCLNLIRKTTQFSASICILCGWWEAIGKVSDYHQSQVLLKITLVLAASLIARSGTEEEQAEAACICMAAAILFLTARVQKHNLWLCLKKLKVTPEAMKNAPSPVKMSMNLLTKSHFPQSIFLIHILTAKMPSARCAVPKSCQRHSELHTSHTASWDCKLFICPPIPNK